MKNSVYALLLLTLSTLLLQCTANQQDPTVEANRALVKQYQAIWSNGHLAELDHLLTPDFTTHWTDGNVHKGIGLIKESIVKSRQMSPDLKVDILDMVAQDNKVAIYYKSSGTFKERYAGISGRYKDFTPTGKMTVIYEASIFRIADGKIAEEWFFGNPEDLENQLKAKK